MMKTQTHTRKTAGRQRLSLARGSTGRGAPPAPGGGKGREGVGRGVPQNPQRELGPAATPISDLGLRPAREQVSAASNRPACASPLRLL